MSKTTGVTCGPRAALLSEPAIVFVASVPELDYARNTIANMTNVFMLIGPKRDTKKNLM